MTPELPSGRKLMNAEDFIAVCALIADEKSVSELAAGLRLDDGLACLAMAAKHTPARLRITDPVDEALQILFRDEAYLSDIFWKLGREVTRVACATRGTAADVRTTAALVSTEWTLSTHLWRKKNDTAIRGGLAFVWAEPTLPASSAAPAR